MELIHRSSFTSSLPLTSRQFVNLVIPLAGVVVSSLFIGTMDGIVEKMKWMSRSVMTERVKDGNSR